MKKLAFAATMLAALSMPAFAADVTSSEWIRDTGASKVKFAPCGQFLCGTISWLKEEGGTAYVGQKVFYDMKQINDTTWEGKAFNPEDGKEYGGKMTLKGNTLLTEGCVLFLCKSTTWNRV